MPPRDACFSRTKPSLAWGCTRKPLGRCLTRTSPAADGHHLGACKSLPGAPSVGLLSKEADRLVASGSPSVGPLFLNLTSHHEISDLRGRLALNVEISAAKLFNEPLRGLVVGSHNGVIAVSRAWPGDWSPLDHRWSPPPSRKL